MVADRNSHSFTSTWHKRAAAAQLCTAVCVLRFAFCGGRFAFPVLRLAFCGGRFLNAALLFVFFGRRCFRMAFTSFTEASGNRLFHSKTTLIYDVAILNVAFEVDTHPTQK